MTTKIQLDTGAMNALFPEGSEARLQLQNAVIANFCQQHLKPSAVGAEVAALVDDARKRAVDHVLQEQGLARNNEWPGRGLTNDSKARIRKLIEDQVKHYFQEQVENAVANCKDEFTGIVEKKIAEYGERLTHEQLVKLIRERLRKAMDSIQ